MTKSLITTLILITGISAQSYFGLLLPTGHELQSTKALAMGGVGVAGSIGYGNLFTNPALLSAGDRRFALSFDGNLRRFEEQRSYPVYDMFDDVVADNVYVSNRNFYSDFNFGFVATLPMGLTAAISRSTFWDFRYDYLEEVRGSLPAGNYNRDPLAGYHEIHNEGKISAHSAGLAWQPWQGLNLGLAAHLLSAIELVNRKAVIVNFQDDALAASNDTIIETLPELANAPMGITAGLAVEPKPGLNIGLRYSSTVTLEMSDFQLIPDIGESTLLPEYVAPDTTTAMTIKLPGTVAAGIQARLPNPIATTAAVEIRRKFWSEYELEYDPMPDTLATLPHNFNDTWEVHAGVEHIILDRLPFRFGVIYAQSPLGREFESTRITVGGGYQVGPAIIDVAAIFGNMSYRYQDIFTGVGEPPKDDLEVVTESQTAVNLSVTIPF